MLVGVQQDLDRLPSHETVRLQGGDRGGFVRIGGGLYAVEATEALVNERER